MCSGVPRFKCAFLFSIVIVVTTSLSKRKINECPSYTCRFYRIFLFTSLVDCLGPSHLWVRSLSPEPRSFGKRDTDGSREEYKLLTRTWIGLPKFIESVTVVVQPYLNSLRRQVIVQPEVRGGRNQRVP